MPETRLESNLDHADPAWQAASGACPFDDGVFFDPADGRFKLWYSAGHRFATALATSPDGIHWERRPLDVVPGTNAVIAYEPDFSRDSFSPWLDHAAARARTSASRPSSTPVPSAQGDGGWLLHLADGVHWRRRARVGAAVGDNTSLFYNGLRGTWALSVRAGRPGRGRVRFYAEHEDFLGLAGAGPAPGVLGRAPTQQRRCPIRTCPRRSPARRSSTAWPPWPTRASCSACSPSTTGPTTATAPRSGRPS